MLPGWVIFLIILAVLLVCGLVLIFLCCLLCCAKMKKPKGEYRAEKRGVCICVLFNLMHFLCMRKYLVNNLPLDVGLHWYYKLIILEMCVHMCMHKTYIVPYDMCHYYTCIHTKNMQWLSGLGIVC